MTVALPVEDDEAVTPAMPRRDLLPFVVAGAIVVCIVVALALDRTVWAAACGAALVAAMWALEKYAARRASEGSFGHGAAVALGGMAARMGLALATLAVIGAAASRDAFIDAALAFLVSYTVYNVARLVWHPAVPAGR